MSGQLLKPLTTLTPASIRSSPPPAATLRMGLLLVSRIRPFSASTTAIPTRRCVAVQDFVPGVLDEGSEGGGCSADVFRGRPAGSARVKVLPLPGMLWQVMVPPWRSTMDLVMDSPRPTPGMAAWRAAFVRKKRVKILVVSSVVMPMPVSRTSSLTQSLLRAARTLTSPPPGEYLMALDTRLSRACPSLSGVGICPEGRGYVGDKADVGGVGLRLG